jgi:hypothetical protein
MSSASGIKTQSLTEARPPRERVLPRAARINPGSAAAGGALKSVDQLFSEKVSGGPRFSEPNQLDAAIAALQHGNVLEPVA